MNLQLHSFFSSKDWSEILQWDYNLVCLMYWHHRYKYNVNTSRIRTLPRFSTTDFYYWFWSSNYYVQALENDKSFKFFSIEKLRNILIVFPIEWYDSNKRLTTAKTFNVLVCMLLVCKYINDYTLIPAILYSLQPGRNPRLVLWSDGGDGAKAQLLT